MQPKHLLPRPNFRYSHAMLSEITMEMIQETSVLPLPTDYLMAGPDGAGGSSSPKGDIEESRDESGLGSGAGADPLKEPEAEKPGNGFDQTKDNHNDNGVKDNGNQEVIKLFPPDEDNWGDIGAGMG